MSWSRCFEALALAALVAGCSSENLGDDDSAGGSSSEGGTGSAQAGAPQTGSSCSAALETALALVNRVSTARVSVLEQSGAERVIYVDASAGGIASQGNAPWVYISLASATRVELTDDGALTSTEWDLGLKRATLRTNSGDSGPGLGGALRINLAWDEVASDIVANQTLPVERWFDQDCVLITDAAGSVLTTFGAWSQYDEMTHVVAPAPVVYITAGGDGTLYKVAILDYYSNADGTHGEPTASGHYKIRIAPLE